MNQLLKLFIDICLLKKGPQDIPVSNWLFRLLIIICTFVDGIILVLSRHDLNAILQAMVEVILILGLTWVILNVAKKQARFQQTVSALLATDILISLLALPIMLINNGSGFVFLIIILLMIWHWVVSGHIFSHALGKPFTFGLGIAFLYILVSIQVMGVLFPEVILTE